MQLVVIGLAGLLIGMGAGQLIHLRRYIWLICVGTFVSCLIVVYGVYFGGTMGIAL